MYERSNSDGARLSTRQSGFGLSGGMGDNGNVNVEGSASPRLLQLFPLKAYPAPMPGRGGGVTDSGLTLGPGESVPPEEGMPGAEPLVDMPGTERPVWLLPVLALGALAVIGGGIWFFTRNKD